MIKRHDNAAERAMYRRNGWPDPNRAIVYTLKQAAMRYALAVFLGGLIGGPAAVYVAISHFCK